MPGISDIKHITECYLASSHSLMVRISFKRTVGNSLSLEFFIMNIRYKPQMVS